MRRLALADDRRHVTLIRVRNVAIRSAPSTVTAISAGLLRQSGSQLLRNSGNPSSAPTMAQVTSIAEAPHRAAHCVQLTDDSLDGELVFFNFAFPTVSNIPAADFLVCAERGGRD